MGLFSPKHKGYYVAGPVASSPKPSSDKADTPPEEDAEDASKPKKVYEKEKAVKAAAEEPQEETETQVNTRLNALLYHTSDDSIDRYRSENNLLDLLGRLYYDDYDLEFAVLTPPPITPAVERVASYTSLTLMKLASNLKSLNHAFAHSTSSVNVNSHSGHVVSPSAVRPLLSRIGSFERQVSFDTLEDKHHMAITLKSKHPAFKFRRTNKTFLLGYSDDAESLRAAEWVFQEIAVNGDTIVVLQVLDEKLHRVADPNLANEVLARLELVNTHSKKVSLVYEVVVGKPQKLLKNAIDEYKPAMMVVGHHHHHEGHLPFLAKSSVSKYFLQFALVPVIVVKPAYKFQEKLEHAVDSELYFQNLISQIDVSRTREKKRRLLSPLISRNGSSTNLEERGREAAFSMGSRDSSRSLSANGGNRLSRLFGH